MTENRKNYIEFRVYLKDEVDLLMVVKAADELQDVVADFTSDYGADIFTEDVTYKVECDMDLKM